MGSEKITVPNMGMDLPINGITTSPYTLTYLISALQKVDSHDHSTGKGARLSQASIQVTDTWVMSGYGFSGTKFIAFSNPATLTDAPNASAYFKNGDWYLKLGGGTELQVTKDNSLNTSLIGGFTGDYASSQAFCLYDEATNTYVFNAKVTSTDTLSNVVVGALEIRSTTATKNLYGIRMKTDGNVAASFDWTLPNALPSNSNNVLNISSAGALSYVNADNYLMTSGAQNVGGAKTFAVLPILTDTNAPTTSNAVRRDYIDGVIAGLTKDDVGLSNVDNTADSNKSVASAATLTTPRTINGTSFNGSSNITLSPPPRTGATTGELVLNYDGTNETWVPNSGGSFPEVPNTTNSYVRDYGAWDTLTLGKCADVVAPSPTLGDFLKFDGTNWIPATVPAADQVSIDVTANPNGITLGNVVELVSTGAQNVQNIYHCEAPTIGSLLTLDGTNNVKDLALSRLTDTTVLAAWNDDTANLGQLAILTAGSPPTMSAVVATSTNDDIQFSSSALASNAVALSYNAGTNGATRIATISGTNITLSTASAITMSASIKSATCALTSSNWFVACADTNNDCQIRTAVSNATNAPTLGTALNVNGTNNANYLSLARTSDTTAMLVLQNSSDSNGEIAHITGGTTNAPTASTLAHLDGTNNCTFITQSPIDSNHTLCAYRNTTEGNGGLAVIQANGANAPTIVSKTVFSTNEVSYCSLSAHTPSIHSLSFIDNSAAQSVTVYIDANYIATVSRKVTTSTTTTASYTAVAALSPAAAIQSYARAGIGGFAGTLTLTPTPVISGQLLGIAETSATNGATASVAIGPIVEGTYTSGADYYVSGSGGIGVTASPVRVGKAKSTTELVLDLGGNPSAGRILSGEITTAGAFTFAPSISGLYTLTLVGGAGSGSVIGLSTSVAAKAGFALRTSLYVSSNTTISGTLGAGGAGSTNAANAGANSTMTVNGKLYTASGGSSIGAETKAASKDNVAGTFPGIGYTSGGIPAFIGGVLTTDTVRDGVRGAGGWSSGSGTSGKGGDGVFAWELVIGS